jgi:hypothetical protein
LSNYKDDDDDDDDNNNNNNNNNNNTIGVVPLVLPKANVLHKNVNLPNSKASISNSFQRPSMLGLL